MCYTGKAYLMDTRPGRLTLPSCCPDKGSAAPLSIAESAKALRELPSDADLQCPHKDQYLDTSFQKMQDSLARFLSKTLRCPLTPLPTLRYTTVIVKSYMTAC